MNGRSAALWALLAVLWFGTLGIRPLYKADESRYGELMKNFPQGRAAKPREIADMMAFLASDRSGYTSGVIVTIDGAASR